MSKIVIKFNRSISDDIPSYGAKFNQLLDDLVGGADRWDTTSSHGLSTVPNSTLNVQRYETGPEIVNSVLPVATAIITLITPIVIAWFESTRKQNETRSVKVTACGKTIEITGYQDRDIQRLTAIMNSKC
ncbi:MAG: hypothetical protein R3C14_20310 [Caldilineaceae bacterium]